MDCEVKVGCCGFAGSMSRYFEKLNVVEIQQTFYRLPRFSTAKRWREKAPEGFEFTVKAFQAITHPTSSPTWRKASMRVHPKLTRRYGLLRPTAENLEAWKKTREIMEALKSRVCLVQCPPSFQLTERNLTNLRRFFLKASRDGIHVAWEPRHRSWHDAEDTVRELCSSLNLIHVTDIFKREPFSENPINYIRLHGLGREINYKYNYTDSDLRSLLHKIEYLSRRSKLLYVFFNNVSMMEDAVRFQDMLKKTV
ncbi:DUF72 domain-containing protein [Candidatus Bathyarchaeota archaeon]|nr:DUF72 domain-containing protein [Candidatus Bathyarchaeota archaeon]